jgi:outer membrane biosynthesis protein TonB
MVTTRAMKKRGTEEASTIVDRQQQQQQQQQRPQQQQQKQRQKQRQKQPKQKKQPKQQQQQNSENGEQVDNSTNFKGEEESSIDNTTYYTHRFISMEEGWNDIIKPKVSDECLFVCLCAAHM